MFSINSGAKHFVVEVDITENHDWESIGRKIRYSASFSPHGTNVNFVKKISQNTLEGYVDKFDRLFGYKPNKMYVTNKTKTVERYFKHHKIKQGNNFIPRRLNN